VPVEPGKKVRLSISFHRKKGGEKKARKNMNGGKRQGHWHTSAPPLLERVPHRLRHFSLFSRFEPRQGTSASGLPFPPLALTETPETPKRLDGFCTGSLLLPRLARQDRVDSR
jgi:hypothetical protein